MSGVVRVGGHAGRRTPVRGVLFDVDGTLLLSDRALGGYEPLPGAIEVLTTLKARHVPFALLTNGSAYPPAQQAAKQSQAGVAHRRRREQVSSEQAKSSSENPKQNLKELKKI